MCFQGWIWTLIIWKRAVACGTVICFSTESCIQHVLNPTLRLHLVLVSQTFSFEKKKNQGHYLYVYIEKPYSWPKQEYHYFLKKEYHLLALSWYLMISFHGQEIPPGATQLWNMCAKKQGPYSVNMKLMLTRGLEVISVSRATMVKDNSTCGRHCGQLQYSSLDT